MSHVHHSVRSESDIPGGRKVHIDFTWKKERLPGILLLPADAVPAPAALLLHGLNLDKERISGSAGQSLLRRGIASLAVDLPLHGERRGSQDPSRPMSPFDMVRGWRVAQEECSVAIRFLTSRPEIDSKRLALMGYSLGAFLGLRVAAAEPLVRSLILVGGGDLPDYIPFISIVRAVEDPMKVVRKLSGRPLLMIHGRHDKAVTPAQAQRLFHAAGHPKELLWWDCGHVFPPEALDHAASWLARQVCPQPPWTAEQIRSLLQ